MEILHLISRILITILCSLGMIACIVITLVNLTLPLVKKGDNGE